MGCPYWVPHDLRRTFATHLEELGISAEVIDRAQNHVKQGVSAVYMRGKRLMEVQAAMEKWGKEVRKGGATL